GVFAGGVERPVRRGRRGWNDLRFPFGVLLLNSSIPGRDRGEPGLVRPRGLRLRPAAVPGRNLLFAIMLGSITLPFQVLMVPQFPIFKELGRLNTFLPLIAPKFLATTAIFTFIRTWSDFFGPL